MVARKKRSKSKYVQPDNYSDCDFCGKQFNWKYGGTANAAGQFFCTDECFNKNRNKKEGREMPTFDSL